MQSKPERLFSNRTLAILIICCLGLIIYSNTFNSSFHFDDDFAIVKNPSIKNLSNLRAIFNFWPPRFITNFSFALNYQISELNVFSYHLVNMLIHLGSAILVWLLALSIFSTPSMIKEEDVTSRKYLISFFAGVIFVSHPIQTQAVTYIVQRAASLATFFYLASLYFYIKSRLFNPGEGKLNTGKFYYFSSLITAFMAMFTKEIAITLPLMIILIEYCFFDKQERNWRKIVPFLGMLLIIPLTLLIAKTANFELNNKLVGYKPNITALSYFFTELRVIITYIRLLFLPINQNVDYDYRIAKSLFELPVLSSLALIIIILIIAARAYPRFRIISFSIFWFFLTLLPESSVMPIQDVIFEHRLYLPMAGFAIFSASMVYCAIGRKSVFTAVLILFLMVNWYSVSAYSRNFDWNDGIALCNDTIAKSPQKARPYYDRGLAYLAKGMIGLAISDFDKVIKINPTHIGAYVNRGVAYLAKGDTGQAISDLCKAIIMNPGLPQAYNDRGNVYIVQGDLTAAISDYNKALQINPEYASAYYNRAVAYFLSKDYDKSWEDVARAEALGYVIDAAFILELKKASKVKS